MAIEEFLIDTSAYSAYKSGANDALEVFQQARLLVLNSVVIGELLSGFAVGRYEKRNRGELEAFFRIPKVIVLPVTLQVAEAYSGIYKNLRMAGTPIPTNDMWIAATAIAHNLSVFTYDSHFEKVDGLKVMMGIRNL